jgi:hypothetical protein
VRAVEAHGWDGAWYRRAYFDDGTPLGSAENDECRIDAIAQSWSVISGAGDPARQSRAMASFEEHLVREDARLLMLLTPAFDRTAKDPGYIKGYLPGVRENGAQYTHAALWSVLATARLGDGDRAFALYRMLNPLTHTDTPEGVATYKVEPYVVAADVYTSPAHLGRGGWTWYTGSASWMYRVGLEAILGFTLRGDTLLLDPRVPGDWPEFTITYRHGGSTYTIVVHQPGAVRAGGRRSRWTACGWTERRSRWWTTGGRTGWRCGRSFPATVHPDQEASCTYSSITTSPTRASSGHPRRRRSPISRSISSSTTRYRRRTGHAPPACGRRIRSRRCGSSWSRC